MSHVLLLNPNKVTVPAVAPYALDVLGTALEDNGHKVSVLDLTKENNDNLAIKNYFSKNSPDMVGISIRNTSDLYFPSFFDLNNQGNFLDNHKYLINEIKKYMPSKKIILGGVGFSSNPEGILKETGLNYGIVGPGESKIVEIANNIDKKNKISNLEFEVMDSRQDSIKGNVRRSYVDNSWYYEKGGLSAVRMSNGCNMKCTYCIEPISNGKNKRQSIKNTIQEINQLIEQGVKDIHTADSEMNIPFNYSKDLLKAIDSENYPNDVRFWGYCQPKPFDDEYAKLLKNANFAGINFGTDHSDKNILKSMGKWYNKKNIVRLNEISKDNGLIINHELLFGYFGDSPSKMYKSLDFFLGLDSWTIGVNLGFAVMPNTKLKEKIINLGINDKSQGLYFKGKPFSGPTFFIDPSFKVPEIFSDLKSFVGNESYRTMIPELNSISSNTSQLVNSKRIKNQLENNVKGAYWYNYRK